MKTRSSSEWVSAHIKPLSINEAWNGRKVKSAKYRRYEEVLLAILPDLTIPIGDLYVKLVVRYRSNRSDIDNCIKPFLDILQKRYHFNDNRVYRLSIRKEVVPKHEEGITFSITDYETKK
jgi:Holliday junction resolvase RusA-like endonuclease